MVALEKSATTILIQILSKLFFAQFFYVIIYYFRGELIIYYMENNSISIKDFTANPAPLGLTGFGLSTMLLNLHNAGLFGMDTMILAMGIMMGGFIQIIVGVMEWKKGNLFGTMAFASYGAFWLSLVLLMILPKLGFGEAPSKTAMGFYLTVWGIFSLGMFIGTFKLNKALVWLFGSVVVLFALLAASNFAGSHTIHTLAGIEGIFCGTLALYIAIAHLLEDLYKKAILPLP